MKQLIYCWLLLTIVGAGVMGFVEKPKPRPEEILVPLASWDYDMGFIPVSCEAKRPCFVQNLTMVPPGGGDKFTGCLISGNEMVLTPCRLSVDDAVNQRSIQ